MSTSSNSMTFARSRTFGLNACVVSSTLTVPTNRMLSWIVSDGGTSGSLSSKASSNSTIGSPLSNALRKSLK